MGVVGSDVAVVDREVVGDDDDGQGEKEGEDVSEGRRREEDEEDEGMEEEEEEEEKEEEKEEEEDKTNWFYSVFGFQEPEEYDDVKSNFYLKAPDALVSRGNGREFKIGTFETPSLLELSSRARRLLELKPEGFLRGKLRVSFVFGDVSNILASSKYRYSTFQHRSWEATGADVACKLTGYVFDRTQGPACAIACAPAAVYRNYFAPVYEDGKVVQHGQTSDRMINNLDDFIKKLKVELPDRKHIRKATQCLGAGLEELLSSVKVTARCQARCHRDCAPDEWELIAKRILDVSYEACFWAAVESSCLQEGQDGSCCLVLTILGGGAFGNDMSWIVDAIGKCLNKFQGYKLDVKINM
ncbi:hypothetical protein GUITHDRAFT_112517 [Guillardia theta CCMP2712]|uniref:Uncharacterized protein n=1 Tax=Guillardia theta (strain CCMP2712) TaxID=905079 RepID=L1IYL1_GUITC|nr:hypothetical protein GUITHDRAFT_112517 [Guillardia theta CCMP2712]EKX41306.1 hypothetical protein GUITHDRAFT_112517 [Guillardia theta CCMP2712]|eukprot:XP_005828286.1 hypothetical protein GUITHDRAFT_112517 [Guillardia theta CCMP2712]